ncbi:MAG TPA: ComEC/Rec2 family competence protein [Sphingobium sp.]
MAFEPRQTSTKHGSGLSFSVLFSVIELWLEKERDHVALWAPVAVGLGIVAWLLLPGPFSWLAWCCACMAMVCGAGLLPAGSRLGAIVMRGSLLACAGCLIIWSKAIAFGERPLARPHFVEMTARIDSVELLPAQASSRLLLSPIGRPDLPSKIRINVGDEDRPAELTQGATIAVKARLMPPAPPAVPGAYDFAQRAYFLGIGATGKALPAVRVIHAPLNGGPTLRQRLSAHIQSRVAGGPGAIAATLATGDRGAIGEEDAEAMRRSGLAHLLSISGLHVTALIGAVIFMIFRLLALSPRLALRWPLLLIAAGGGALAGIGYTLLTGADVPTVRSCVAALLVLGGLALGRDSLTLRLVASGAMFVLLFWPESLAGPSFQMSFTAVTVIVALGEHPRFRRHMSARDEPVFMRFGRHLLGLFLTGLAIEIALAPIALFHFHQAGMLGAVANLVAIPLTTFVVMPFEALALLLDGVGMGLPAWWVVEKALALLLFVAHGVAASPGAVALTPAISGTAFGLTVIGGLWWLLWRSRVRWWGAIPIILGTCLIVMTPKPDVLVTGDGRHVAIRLANGHMAILRDRAGDYVRDTLSESAGYDGELTAFEDLPSAHCNRDMWAVDIIQGERRWRLLATRSLDLVPAYRLARDCAEADIVVSERRLPRNCRPRWLRIDRSMLRRTGGVAVYLKRNHIQTVKRPGDRHPWMTSPGRSHSRL